MSNRNRLKLGGTVCWENISDNGITYPLQVRYSLHQFDLFRGSVVAWKLSTHTLGETVPLKDGITITMDRAAISNNGDSLSSQSHHR